MNPSHPDRHQVIIIGGGLSGLSVAHFLHKADPSLQPLLLEASDRPGGAIRTWRQQGYLAEWGPHGFLDNNPASQELLRDLGLDQVAQKAALGAFARYLCHRGSLVALPQSPAQLLTTPLLSLTAKLRLLAEPWIRPASEPQTIGAWAARRFGRGVLPLVDAAVTGTFAGDYTRLSIEAVMPGLRRLEQETGSVLRGLLRKRKKAGGRPLPAMTSFAGGMEQLVTTLAADKRLRFQTVVTGIHREKDNSLRLETTNGECFQARTVVLALPVNPALALLAPFAPPLTKLAEARIATVVLAFADQGQIPAAFGYLAPEEEGRFALGAMFSSRMFPGRAPAGTLLLEALVGGRRHPERLALADETLIKRVLEDIRPLLSLSEPPLLAQVLRSPVGIPQLEMDYLGLARWRRDLAAMLPGLELCGFGWNGIGMNDMIQGARECAARILDGGRRPAGTAAVKPIYF